MGESKTPSVILHRDDYRTIHAAKVLKINNGDLIRAGVVNCGEDQGLSTDEASITWIPEGKVKKAEPLGNGDPPGSLKITLNALMSPSERFKASPVSLILALPRPLQLGRMLPMISQMGVDHLILTEARKVPKDYFGSHLFRNPQQLTERLIEGLCQSGDVRLPHVQIVRSLREFLDNDMNRLFPFETHARVIAHPLRSDGTEQPQRIRDVIFPMDLHRRIVIAVGPEGGWEEPDELELFRENGFQQITMGARTLRSDCAVVSLLALAHDICERD